MNTGKLHQGMERGLKFHVFQFRGHYIPERSTRRGFFFTHIYIVIRYNLLVTKTVPTVSNSNQPLHRALAEFRHQLRVFLLASEEAAHRADLHPQQHQLLLTVAGAPPHVRPSIAYAAQQLELKHNTVVELVDRCAKDGLLQRTADPSDGRRVCLQITARGQQILDRLSQVHLQELHLLAPRLIRSLQKVLRTGTKSQPAL